MKIEGVGCSSLQPCACMQPPVAADAAAAAQWRAPSFNFYDARLLGGAWRNEARPDILREFFRILAVCHTVIPDGVRSSERVQGMIGAYAPRQCQKHARWLRW